MENPIMVEATRGNHQESRHRGVAVIVDSLGHVVRSWGNIYDPVFGRSSLKFIQALPLIESGAADAFNLSPQEIALACASHRGEEIHIKALEIWLQKIGKDERILDCGIPQHFSSPFYSKSSVLHNACSGKHLGFLTTALYRKESLEGYSSREHPVQQRVERALTDLTDIDHLHAPYGIDGCGIPSFTLPLYNIALSMARFADPSHLHYPRQKAIHRILGALEAHPEMIAGAQGFDTKVIKLTHGQVLCKMGAAGVEAGIIPSLSLGIALKIEDGNAKAAELAFLAILKSLGLLDADLYEMLGAHVPILTHKGKTVGFMQPTNFTTVPLETGWH
ncbi:MAG: asparaginase [Alphaproteobacteria bacterium]|nr:asparaginase [Alphaproteobacteria bacterium]